MNTHPPFIQIAGSNGDVFALDQQGRVWRLKQRLEDGKIIETWARISEEAE